MTKAYYSNELYHYGVKGMHWGIRRYQNADGTLTDAGKRHERKLKSKRINKERKIINKYRNTLSDKELNDHINRLNQEKRLSELSSKKYGRQSEVSKAFKTAAGITATAAFVAGAAFIARSGITKIAVKSLTEKTISLGRKSVDKLFKLNTINNTEVRNKSINKQLLKLEKAGRVVAKDLRSIDMDNMARMIKLKKK